MKELLPAFIMGGALCLIAQLLIDLTRLTPAKILVIYVTAGVFLYGIGVFSPLKEIFGAGVTLPLLGFGANIADGVREAVEKSGLIGALTGGLTSSAAGITAALLLGLLSSLVLKTGPKRM